MSEVNLDQKVAIAEARARGCKVYRGNPRRLLLDLDEEGAMMWFEDQLELINDSGIFGMLTFKMIGKWRSYSGNGWHIILELNTELSLPERLLLQACLGSDLKRELYSLARYHAGQAEPSLLFKPPKTKPETKHDTHWINDDDVPF